MSAPAGRPLPRGPTLMPAKASAPALASDVGSAHTISMDLQIVSAVVLPILMLVGGIAAWRVSMRQQVEKPEAERWRDDSLDDWRKERDARADEARANRPAELRETVTGQEEQQETTTTKHQRIGG